MHKPGLPYFTLRWSCNVIVSISTLPSCVAEVPQIPVRVTLSSHTSLARNHRAWAGSISVESMHLVRFLPSLGILVSLTRIHHNPLTRNHLTLTPLSNSILYLVTNSMSMDAPFTQEMIPTGKQLICTTGRCISLSCLFPAVDRFLFDQTNNLEWYDPAAITTRNGALEITLSNIQTHGLDYQGGLMSTWNKFCFTGGLVETSVTLPGYNNIIGLWPAIWTLGNLGLYQLIKQFFRN